jgi:predicted permease
MFKNHLKIAWRNMIRDKQFTLLNLVGLSTGIACALLIYLWVSDEYSVDKFYPDLGQIYQLMETRTYSGNPGISDESSGPLARAVKTRVSEVEYAAALAPPNWFQKFTLTVEDKNIKAWGQYAGEDYFNIFAVPLIEGDRDNLLKINTSIVLSESVAKKLFGKATGLIGQPIRFQHDTTFHVSGIFKDLPANSSQQFDFVMPFEYYGQTAGWVEDWGNGGPHNFVKLRLGADLNTFNRRISNLVTENCGDTTRKVFALAFSGAYLQNSFVHGARVGGRLEYVRLFSLVAIFILVIACINFMNLSTAKASKRLKEVGIKKVVGADRGQLVFQFLSESFLLSLIAALFALLLTWLLIPSFNQITGKNLHFRLGPTLFSGLAAITLITGLLAGSYPAFYLSGFQPVSILKNKLRTLWGEIWARKGLVVFQFTITITLIISVLVVYRQLELIQHINLGFNKDNIVRFSAEGRILQNEEGFISELKKIPGVVNASYTTHGMIGRNYGGDMIIWPGRDPNGIYYFEGINAGYDFIETMNMQMAAGRSYSRSYGLDTTGIIINETAARSIGWKNPVGRMVKWFGADRQIIGVVKDCHFESLHQPVVPLYIALNPYGNSWDKIMVRISSNDQKETISSIEALYKTFNPDFPFEFNFLDDAYQAQYDAEKKVSILSKYFAGLAIIISCLGLFGLAAFTARRRQKEIGIRKIVGASSSNIFQLLSRDFLYLIFIAMLLAFPLSMWLMSLWLMSFSYRVPLGWVVFVVAALVIILISMLTVSFQALKAAISSPVKSLRTE